MKFNTKHLCSLFFLFICLSAYPQICSCDYQFNLDKTELIADSLLLMKDIQVNKFTYRNECKFNEQNQRYEHWHCYLKDSTKYQIRYTCLIINPVNGNLISEVGIVEAFHNLDNCCCTPIMEIELLDSSKLSDD